MAPCVFCGFDDPEVMIHRDPRCFALVDAEPINPYHLLVVPTDHYEDFVQLPPDLLAHLFQVAQRLSRAVRQVSNPVAITHLTDDDVSRSGYNLVPHFKIHVIPRFKGDKVRIEWNRDAGLVSGRRAMASDIRRNLDPQ
jgi:diadenosine tetraphosphate (Ap4A) HIT family hydrolase